MGWFARIWPQHRVMEVEGEWIAGLGGRIQDERIPAATIAATS
jgi:hypothetical protein